MDAPKKFTHYSYMGQSDGTREPTGLYDLSRDDPQTRRQFIHQLYNNGELVAPLPFSDIKDMRQLRGTLDWLRKNRGE